MNEVSSVTFSHLSHIKPVVHIGSLFLHLGFNMGMSVSNKVILLPIPEGTVINFHFYPMLTSLL